MTVTTDIIDVRPPADERLGSEVLAHLDAQLHSAGRLRAIVLEQAVAIRQRNVHRVVALSGLLQAELERREMLERGRTALLDRVGAHLGCASGEVTIELLCTLLDPETAQDAHERSQTLRGMLREIRREHQTNRALMGQQLSFLDHLLRLADVEETIGYGSRGQTRNAGTRLTTPHRVFDLEV